MLGLLVVGVRRHLKEEYLGTQTYTAVIGREFVLLEDHLITVRL